MKHYIAALFLMLGIVGGLYVGCYEFFIKGVVLVIDSIKTTPVNSWDLAIGAFKILTSSFFGWITFGIGFLIAQAIEN